jgi:putative membrane protein
VRGLLIRWLINTLAIYLAIRLVPGVHYVGGPMGLVIVALLFGLVNATLRPILTFLTCPLVLFTLGFFILVINGLLLMLTGWLSTKLDLGFSVDGFGSAFLAGLLIGIVSTILSVAVGEHQVKVQTFHDPEQPPK